MPDDFILNVRQISQYAAQASATPDMMLLVQRGGIGGAYGSIAPFDLVGSTLEQGSFTVGGTLSAGELLSSTASIDQLNVNGVTAQALDATALTVGGAPVALQSAVAAQIAQLAARPFVASVAGRTGAVMLSVDDVMGAAPAHSPFFGGTPRANTPWGNANDGELVTAEWVRNFFLNGNAVASFNGRRGAVRLRLTDVLEAGGAPINTPSFVGKPTAPTPPGYDSSDRLATTKFVQWAIVEGGWQGPIGPPGPQGPPGTGFNFRGTVPTAAALPMAGNQVSDLFIAQDTNIGYVWTGSAWQPIGMITPSARVYVADTAPIVAGDGDLWWSSLTGELFVYYQGPSGGQWVQANTGIEGAQGPEGPVGPAGPNVSIGATAPVGPSAGQLWFNPATGNTQLWDGAQWLPVSEPTATVSVGPTQPTGAAEGDLWFDTSTTGELMIFMQGAWVAVGAEPGPIGPPGPQGPPGLIGPQGPQGVIGPPGIGIQFRGQQPTLADIQALPSPATGDAWVDASSGDLWVFDGSAWDGPYPFGGGIAEAPTPGIYGRENGAWVALLDDGVF